MARRSTGDKGDIPPAAPTPDMAAVRGALGELSDRLAEVNATLEAENLKRDARIASSEEAIRVSEDAIAASQVAAAASLRTGRQNRVLAIVGGIVGVLALVAAGLGIGVAVRAHNQVSDICKSGNQVRSEITAFVSDLTSNSERAAQATLANPASTAEQRAAATRNLASIRDAEQKLHARLVLKDC